MWAHRSLNGPKRRIRARAVAMGLFLGALTALAALFLGVGGPGPGLAGPGLACACGGLCGALLSPGPVALQRDRPCFMRALAGTAYAGRGPYAPAPGLRTWEVVATHVNEEVTEITAAGPYAPEPR
jgi:hypothetical protein